ncbi:glutamyl-tRNA(Gln) amidotransferase subunit A, mitochondrial-like [Gigantopelta aegis]|uniref:glutamyl-tRNA(Gln) amidotransferase subunit A, mitochondrial-like n=1 Tax=Gigantopelta aegis TaxID=1735272 RepID=UPI001B88AE09|nr:glutamyl-tRNA(Gln) amidotransferase subunit A, mitochondrial-like [Gigantopelta aegis]
MLSLSLKEVLSRFKDGKVSPTELCTKCLERLRKVRELNAFISELPEKVQSEASRSSQRLLDDNPPRVLEGIPISYKDNFCTLGVKTTCASKMLASYVPPYNATMVERALQQGAVLMGKTNMDEFAMGSTSTESTAGPVKNPWKFKFKKCKSLDHGQTSNTRSSSLANKSSLPDQSASLVEEEDGDWFLAGGSSGGSVVSVASGVCCASLGSDTGGSTRLPASFCGVVGLKATYGVLSRHGLIPLVNSMDVPGIITRTVDDAAIVLNTLAGHDVMDSTTVRDKFQPVTLPDEISVKNLHVGIPKEYYAPGVTPDVLAAWSRAADMFERAGAKVSQVSLPHTQYSIVCYSVLCCCEVASNMARYDGIQFGHRGNNDESTDELYALSRHEGFNTVVRSRILTGNWYLLRKNYDDYFIKAQKVRRKISEDFAKVFNSGVDVLLTPTSLSEAPSYRQSKQIDHRALSEQQDVFTQPANMAGIPAVTVPACLSSNGLPIGLQLMGPHFSEQMLLSTAKWFEQNTRFPYLNLDFLDKRS